jgi:hypothetical protein
VFAVATLALILLGCDPVYRLGVRNQSDDRFFVEVVSADSIESTYEVPPKALGWIVERFGSGEHATLLRSDCSPVTSWDHGGVILIDEAGQARLTGSDSIQTAAKMSQVLGCGSATPP